MQASGTVKFCSPVARVGLSIWQSQAVELQQNSFPNGGPETWPCTCVQLSSSLFHGGGGRRDPRSTIYLSIGFVGGSCRDLWLWPFPETQRYSELLREKKADAYSIPTCKDWALEPPPTKPDRNRKHLIGACVWGIRSRMVYIYLRSSELQELVPFSYESLSSCSVHFAVVSVSSGSCKLLNSTKDKLWPCRAKAILNCIKYPLFSKIILWS